MSENRHTEPSAAPRPRLLAAGVGPLPPETPERLYAPGLRLWGMARELARAGHAVRLVERLFGEGEGAARTARVFDLPPGGAEAGLPAPREARVAAAEWPAFLRGEAEAFGARAAAASTDVMNAALAQSGLAIPLWFDFFGDPMAERQMLAAAFGSDGGLEEQWALLAPALARGDRFSGCGAEQAGALLGELGGAGRLNRYTAREPLTQTLKPWITPLAAAALPAGAKAFRGKTGGAGFPAEAFVAIQSGGFNTWLDHAGLFEALERAMEQAPGLRFACTGGAIEGHFGGGFREFAARAGASRFAERFHLLGWLPLGMMPHLFAEADAAVNLDLPCAEGRLGTRNRLLDWALAGLPAISTPGSPLAEELAALGGVELVPHGDPRAAGDALARLANAGAKRLPEASVRRIAEAHAPEKCLAPLIEWAAAPQRAPDLQAWEAGASAPPALWIAAQGAAAAGRQTRQLAERAERAERRLQELEGSRLVRLALKLKKRNRS